VNIIANEFVVYWIICSTNIGEEGGLGLIINFASAIIICELDDLYVQSARVHDLMERFEEDENDIIVDDAEAANDRYSYRLAKKDLDKLEPRF
jgi:hypothetical protein